MVSGDCYVVHGREIMRKNFKTEIYSIDRMHGITVDRCPETNDRALRSIADRGVKVEIEEIQLARNA